MSETRENRSISKNILTSPPEAMTTRTTVTQNLIDEATYYDTDFSRHVLFDQIVIVLAPICMKFCSNDTI